MDQRQGINCRLSWRVARSPEPRFRLILTPSPPVSNNTICTDDAHSKAFPCTSACRAGGQPGSAGGTDGSQPTYQQEARGVVAGSVCCIGWCVCQGRQ